LETWRCDIPETTKHAIRRASWESNKSQGLI
jgi:hypothetical protein